MKLAFTTALALATAAPAFAQSPPNPQETSKTVAANKDGKLAVEDGKSPPAPSGPLSPLEMFKKMDTNKDGVVTKQEAEAAHMPASVFDMLDANKDGKLVVDEVKDLPTPSGPPPQP